MDGPGVVSAVDLLMEYPLGVILDSDDNLYLAAAA
jgi:hypothetical protein